MSELPFLAQFLEVVTESSLPVSALGTRTRAREDPDEVGDPTQLDARQWSIAVSGKTKTQGHEDPDFHDVDSLQVQDQGTLAPGADDESLWQSRIL